MEDNAIIDRLFFRDDTALGELEEKYGPRLFRLAGRFLSSREDAEEAVNDTWLRTWNTIPPNRPAHLFAYLAALCRRTALERVEYLTAQKRSAPVVELTQELAQCLPSPAAPVGEEGEVTRALNGFLAGLGREKRAVFLRRYWYGDPIRDISRRLGMGESRVKTTLFRLRKDLKEYLEKEGIFV